MGMACFIQIKAEYKSQYLVHWVCILYFETFRHVLSEMYHNRVGVWVGGCVRVFVFRP